MAHEVHGGISGQRSGARWSRWHATGVMIGLYVVGTVAVSGPLPLPSHAGTTVDEVDHVSAVTQGQDVPSSGFVAVAEMVTKAVVNIAPAHPVTSSSRQHPLNHPWRFFDAPGWPYHDGMPHQRRTGSGVVVSANGHIVTNYHLVEGVQDVRVTWFDGNEATGTVLGTDPQTDLAVITVDRDTHRFLKWGSSADLKVGEPVLAVGTPFGLASTVTQGIVSGLGRSGMGITRYEDFIQTDAAINPGNSGGALVNARGELVGINTAIMSRTGGNLGVGFAIPSDMAKRVYKDLVMTGTVRRGYLGVQIQSVTPDLAKAFKLEHPRGVLIASVEQGSPAEQAGMVRGDIVISFEGEDVATPRDLQHAVIRRSVGAPVELTVVRDGETITLKAVLGGHQDDRRTADVRSGDRVANVLTSVRVDAVDAAMARRLGLDRGVSGVVVTSLLHGSPAERSGLARGDVIIEMNGTPIGSTDEYERIVAGLAHDEDVLLYVWRNRVPMFMTVTA